MKPWLLWFALTATGALLVSQWPGSVWAVGVGLGLTSFGGLNAGLALAAMAEDLE